MRMQRETDYGKFKEKKEKGDLIPGAPVLGQALLTINRSSFRRLERYFTFFSTV